MVYLFDLLVGLLTGLGFVGFCLLCCFCGLCLLFGLLMICVFCFVFGYSFWFGFVSCWLITCVDWLMSVSLGFIVLL